MAVVRLPGNPIITPELDPSLGVNINGPSLIRVPDWLPNSLGRYYLYFGHHSGKFIRLAYANDLTGPWHIYRPGTLRLEQTPCIGHIASPDIRLDHERQEVLLYYHGPTSEAMDRHPRCYEMFPLHGRQRTFLAVSGDGLSFSPKHPFESLGSSYMRVFEHDGWWYGLAMPGIFFRSRDGRHHFEQGPWLFPEAMRHAAVRVRGDRLDVYYTLAGDCPERILRSTVDLHPNWHHWHAGPPEVVLEPELDWEGGRAPLEASRRGAIAGVVRQLRDPAIFEEDGQVYLLYSCGGESGIAIAHLEGE